MKIILTALLVCMGLASACVTTEAQTRFTVLAVRGDVYNGKSSVRVGNKLSTKDDITVKKGGYVSLAHVNGRAIEINKTGSYKVKQLDSDAKKKSGSSTSKFAKYVVDELTTLEDPIEFTSGRRGKMRTTGSVERALGDDVNVFDSVLTIVGGPNEIAALAGKQNNDVSTGAYILVLTPRDTRVATSSMKFLWKSAPKTSAYVVKIYDRNGNQTFSEEISDTTIRVDLNNAGVVKGQLSYWSVNAKDNANLASDEFSIYRLPTADELEITGLEMSIAEDYDSDNAAIGQLVLATAYEDMGLTYAAQMAYSNAISIAPSVQNYKRMYAQFLKRQGLNAEAYMVYN